MRSNYISSFDCCLGDISSIGSIKLILGRACNMSCPHCSQNVCKDEIKTTIIDDAVLDFVFSLAKEKQNKTNKILNISFWGGEPLLYWNIIVNIVDALKLKGLSSEDISYSVFTNGLLLTREKIAYMESNNFILIMSYDSPNPLAIRSNVPSQENIDLFNSYVGKKIVNSVYNAKTESLYLMYEKMNEIFPNANKSMGWIRDGVGVPKDLVTFPPGKVEQDLKELYFSTFHELSDCSSIFKNFYQIYEKRKLDCHSYASTPFPHCNSMIKLLTMDLIGNIYICHNAEHLIGNILNESFSNLQLKALKIWGNALPSKCRDCKWLGICKNGCTEYTRTDDGKSLKQCAFFQEYYNTLEKIMILGEI